MRRILNPLLVILLLVTFVPPASAQSPDEEIATLVDAANAGLEAAGANVRVGIAESFSAWDEMGQTIFFNNVGNKQLGADFVPDDARRAAWSNGSNPDITYVVQGVGDASNLSLAVTTAAIDRAMATWDALTCSDLPIAGLPPFAGELGIVENGFTVPILADITHAGWIPLAPPTLGVTFTLIFVDPTQPGTPPTDVDGNGKLDTAIREIYYSSLFLWADDGASNIDVETVALHEAGHGLSQAHFGKLIQTTANGQFHFAPAAVMNAGYTGPRRGLLGTDNGGHCSNWSSWPNN